MSVIRWEEPPTPKSGRNRYADTANVLRSRPGEWALIAHGLGRSGASALAVRIRAGSGPWAPRGAFDARTSESAGNGVSVYVRYVGESS